MCHLRPGTSKWNRIELRLFAHIRIHWRGRTLTSHEVVVDLIAATTRSGLTLDAELDEREYPKGVKVTDQQMAAPGTSTTSTTGTTPSTTKCQRCGF